MPHPSLLTHSPILTAFHPIPTHHLSSSHTSLNYVVIFFSFTLSHDKTSKHYTDTSYIGTDNVNTCDTSTCSPPLSSSSFSSSSSYIYSPSSSSSSISSSSIFSSLSSTSSSFSFSSASSSTHHFHYHFPKSLAYMVTILNNLKSGNAAQGHHRSREKTGHTSIHPSEHQLQPLVQSVRQGIVL